MRAEGGEGRGMRRRQGGGALLQAPGPARAAGRAPAGKGMTCSMPLCGCGGVRTGVEGCRGRGRGNKRRVRRRCARSRSPFFSLSLVDGEERRKKRMVAPRSARQRPLPAWLVTASAGLAAFWGAYALGGAVLRSGGGVPARSGGATAAALRGKSAAPARWGLGQSHARAGRGFLGVHMRSGSWCVRKWRDAAPARRARDRGGWSACGGPLPQNLLSCSSLPFQRHRLHRSATPAPTQSKSSEALKKKKPFSKDPPP